MSLDFTSPDFTDQSFLRELRHPLILRPLSEMVNTSQSAIKHALELRSGGVEQIEVERGNGKTQVCDFESGYHHFTIPKSNGDIRQIHEPAPVIKALQYEIREILLSQVPTHVGAFAGDPGRSFVENAEIHARNRPRFLVNIDLKDAYPSAFGERIHANMYVVLSKRIDISFPHLSDEEKNYIVSAITLLLTCNDTLPQGSPASMKVLNIILARVDKRISSYIQTGDQGLHSPQYTRYVDDITVGWKDFSDTYEIWRKRTRIHTLLKDLSDISGSLSHSEDIVSKVGSISGIFTELENHVFLINSEKHRVHIIALCKKIEKDLERFQVIPVLKDILHDLMMRIRIFKKQVSNMERQNYPEAVAGHIRKILIHEGWTVNDNKTTIRTPTSSQQKIVTGVSIDSKGRLGIPKKTMEKFMNFMKVALDNPLQLHPKYHGNEKLIGETIVGMYQFVTQVKGEANSQFRNLFVPCQKKYFPTRNLRKPAVGVKFKYDGEIQIQRGNNGQK